MNQPTPRVAVRSRTALIGAGLVLVLLGAALGVWIRVHGNGPIALDTWWNEAVGGVWAPILVGFSRVMNSAGGGWIGVLGVPILGAVGLVLLRRPWGAAYFLGAELLSVWAVQVLKSLLARPRPDDMLVTSDFGSFPSGHTANAATIAVVAFVLFPRVWVAVVGSAWVLLMAFTRTYLHVHWLTDTVGGTVVGAGVALVLAGALAPLLVSETADVRRRPPSLG